MFICLQKNYASIYLFTNIYTKKKKIMQVITVKLTVETLPYIDLAYTDDVVLGVGDGLGVGDALALGGEVLASAPPSEAVEAPRVPSSSSSPHWRDGPQKRDSQDEAQPHFTRIGKMNDM